MKLSELDRRAARPAVREFLSPTVGYTVSFGSLHGYLEAYGDQADAVTVKYEIADAPGRAGADRGRRAGPTVRRRSDDLHAR